jgi:hypothetical protein
VVNDHGHEHEHKVVSVEHRGTTVSVLFQEGTRELHNEDAYARVRLGHATDQR